jgi:hypothetical protein
MSTIVASGPASTLSFAAAATPSRAPAASFPASTPGAPRSVLSLLSRAEPSGEAWSVPAVSVLRPQAPEAQSPSKPTSRAVTTARRCSTILVRIFVYRRSSGGPFVHGPVFSRIFGHTAMITTSGWRTHADCSLDLSVPRHRCPGEGLLGLHVSGPAPVLRRMGCQPPLVCKEGGRTFLFSCLRASRTRWTRSSGCPARFQAPVCRSSNRLPRRSGCAAFGACASRLRQAQRHMTQTRNRRMRPIVVHGGTCRERAAGHSLLTDSLPRTVASAIMGTTIGA